MTKLAIKLFGYDNAKIITNRFKNGQRWYMAEKVCMLLGISDYSKAVNKPFKKDAQYTLQENEHMKSTEFTGTSNRELLFVNTNGMFKLIMQSSKEFASEVRAKALELKKDKLFIES